MYFQSLKRAVAKRVWWLLPILPFVLAAGLCLDYMGTLPNYLPIDDSYIILSYARNVLEHGEVFSYNPGTLSTGITSPLYCLLLAAGKALTGDWIASVRLVGGLSFVLGLGTGGIWLWRICGGQARGAIAAGIFSVIWGCWGYADFFAFCGMEPILFIALALGAMLAYDADRVLLAGCLLGAGCLCRPEGLFLFAAMGLPFAVRTVCALFRKDRAALWPAVRSGLLLAAGFSAVFGVWLVRCLQVSGTLLPSTVAMKTGSPSWSEIGHYLSVFLHMYDSECFDMQLVTQNVGGTDWIGLRSVLPFSLFALLAVPVLWRQRRMALLPLLYPVLHFLLTCTKNTVVSDNQRYLPFDYALVLAYVSVAVAGLCTVEVKLHDFGGVLRSLALRGIGVLLGVGLCILVLTDRPRHVGHFNLMSRYFRQLDYVIGEWLAKNTPTDARVALFQAGGIKFFSNRFIVDGGGVTDHTMFPYLKGGLGMGQALVDRGVDYVAPFGEEWLASEGLDMRDTRFFTCVPLPCRGLYRVNKPALKAFVEARRK